MGKRCVCGKSRRPPLCDGSHASLGWTCTDLRVPRSPWAFVAGPHEENLAERLASELHGVAVHAVTHAVRAERLVVIANGASLGDVRALAARVDAARCRVVALDLDLGVASSLFPGAEVVAAGGEGAIALWRSVRDAVTRDVDAPPVPRALVPAFVSHAVADEAQILKALSYLREHVGADLFLCGDSIPVGTRWHDTIVGELRRRPVLVWLLSRRSAASTSCAFEVGFATASAKRVVIISLDGERPPTFAQHLHAIDIDRRRAARPWLDAHEAMADAMIEALVLA